MKVFFFFFQKNKTKQNPQPRCAWWEMPIIPVMQKEEVGGLWFEAGLGNSIRPYMRNELKAKGTGA
jgi:hypothetical protein